MGAPDALVTRLERRLGIEGSEVAAERCVTVGELYEVVYRQLCGEGAAAEPSSETVDDPGYIAMTVSRAYVAIRRCIARELGIQERRVIPETDVRQLIPRDAVQRVWSAAKALPGISLPTLSRPRWLKLLVVGPVAVVSLLGLVSGICIAMLGEPGDVLCGITVGALAVGLFWSSERAMAHTRFRIPAGYRTLRHLASYVAGPAHEVERRAMLEELLRKSPAHEVVRLVDGHPHLDTRPRLLPGGTRQAVLDRVQRAVAGVVRGPSDRVRPAATFEEALQKEDVREDWAALGDRLGWRLPPLDLTVGQKVFLRTFGAIAGWGLGGGLLLVLLGGRVEWMRPVGWTAMAGGLVFGLLVCVGRRLLATVAMRPPRACPKVEDLAEWICAHNSLRDLGWSHPQPDEVWPIFRSEVAKELGLPCAEVMPSCRWYEDLCAVPAPKGRSR